MSTNGIEVGHGRVVIELCVTEPPKKEVSEHFAALANGDYDAVLNAAGYVKEETCTVENCFEELYQSGGPYKLYEHHLSCYDVFVSFYDTPPNYCPECGAKVVDE